MDKVKAVFNSTKENVSTVLKQFPYVSGVLILLGMLLLYLLQLIF